MYSQAQPILVYTQSSFKLLINLDRKEDQASREALLKDDLQTAHLLQHILRTESHKYEVLELRGSAAEAVLDIIHTVWI